jgi:NADH dehydrogenase
VSVLHNTYWVRFNHKKFTFAQAVVNSAALFRAAREAGVERIIHVSVANPSLDSPFEYFRGKAQVERALGESGVPHTILRPAVFFGEGDILINNIAWGLRYFPAFGVFGDGQYRLQPIFVDDFAKLAVAEGSQSGDRTIDAVGPETFTYRGIAEMLRDAMGLRTPLVSIPPSLGYAVTRFAGFFLGDVILTREEIGALMADLLCTNSPPVGATRLSDWAHDHAETLGREYASELGRRR